LHAPDSIFNHNQIWIPSTRKGSEVQRGGCLVVAPNSIQRHLAFTLFAQKETRSLDTISLSHRTGTCTVIATSAIMSDINDKSEEDARLDINEEGGDNEVRQLAHVQADARHGRD
jgi:hypothetical protein